MNKRRTILLILVLLNILTFALIREQPDCAASMECPQAQNGNYVTETFIPIAAEPIDMAEIVFREGECQHFMREEGEPESRLVYRGELANVQQ